MPCSGCGSEFGFLKKEVGCPKCGFSFCTKCCCQRKCVAVTGEAYKQIICNKCFKDLSGERTQKMSRSPPLAHKKRMEKFGSRSVSLGGSSFDNEKDKEIAERLQKLKRERQKEAMPSQNEIEQRLARLKGMDPSKYTAPPIQVFRPADKRTSVQQATDLMKQIQEEVEIDQSRVKPEDEIASRLANLKDEPVPAKPGEDQIIPNICSSDEPTSQEIDLDNEAAMFAAQQKASEIQAMEELQDLDKDPELKRLIQSAKEQTEKEGTESDVDEDAEADVIIEKLLATNIDNEEVEDPESLNGGHVQSTTDSSEENDSEPDNVSWCVICDKDATLKCSGCSGDTYCRRCFKEEHSSHDMKNHKAYPSLCSKVVP